MFRSTKTNRATHAGRRKFLLAAGSAALAAGLPCTGFAQEPGGFPNRPLRMIVPYAPGGTADILARLLGERLSAEVGQPVVVENRVGAGTAIASRYVATAAPDGYTLMIGTTTSHVMNPALQPGIGYDPIRDFTAISAISEIPYVIVTHPGRGFRTLSDLVERARAQPGKLSYGSAGAGSANHLAGELLALKENLNLIHVPYRGSAPALNDVLAGQIDFMFDLVTTAQPHLRAGTLTGLATTAAARSPVLPEVPTTAEAGAPDLVVGSWFGIFAPAGIPEPARRRLSDAIAAVLAQPAIRQRLTEQGGTLLSIRDDAFQSFVEKDFRQWSQVIQTRGLAQTIK